MDNLPDEADAALHSHRRRARPRSCRIEQSLTNLAACLACCLAGSDIPSSSRRRGPSMQVFRPVLRRRLLPSISRFRSCRTQHNYGPHKEYFQNPNQVPVPDNSPYDPNVGVQTVPVSLSRTKRAFRSIFWASLFSSLGLVAGAGLITWEYLQPPYEPGSQEEKELHEEVVDTMETCRLVEELREEGWIEEEFYHGRSHAEIQQGLHLVQEKLVGIQGLIIKAFKHPTYPYTILVAFTGFGIEGWPDVVHGGVITSLLEEGMRRHHANFYKEWGLRGDWGISVDFQKPMHPGEIYSILLPPAGLEDIPGDPTTKQLRLVALLMQMEVAPKLGTQFDATTRTETHTVEISTMQGIDVTHAVGKASLAVMNERATDRSIENQLPKP